MVGQRRMLRKSAAMFFLDLRATTPTHAHHQLMLLIGGATELDIEGRGERITASRGCVIPCAHHHEYRGDGCNRTFVLDITVDSQSSLLETREFRASSS